MKKTLFFLLALISYSCSSKSEHKAEYDHLNQGLSIGTQFLFEVAPSENFFFGNIADVKILSDGNIAVLDDETLSLHILNSDGDIINSISLQGKGPGEVQNLFKGLRLTEEDYIAIYDYLMFKISIFQVIDNQLRHIRDITLESDESSKDFYLNSNDQVVLHKSASIRNEQNSEHVIVVNINGEIKKENLLEIPHHSQLTLSGSEGDLNFVMDISTPYHTINHVCTFDNHLFHTRTDSVGFTVYDINYGKRIASTHLKMHPERLTSEEKEREVEKILGESSDFFGASERAGLLSEMPEFKPLVKKVVCDMPEGIWQELMNNENEEVAEWFLFTDSGEIKGMLNTDFEGEIVNIHKRRIFVIETNDLGEITLKVYRYSFNMK